MKKVQFAITGSCLHDDGSVSDYNKRCIEQAIRLELRDEVAGTERPIDVLFDGHICTVQTGNMPHMGVQKCIGNALYGLGITHAFVPGT